MMAMTVGELTQLLSQFPQEAVVVIGDPNDGGVGKLREEDLRNVCLRFGEADGLGWYEVVDPDESFDILGVWIG